MSTRMRHEIEFGNGSRIFQFEDGRLFVVPYEGAARREVKEEKELIVELMKEIEE